MNRFSAVLKTHCQSFELTPKNPLYRRWLFQFTFEELEKDLNKHGDITTASFFNKNSRSTARIVAKESGILAGAQEITFFLKRYKRIAFHFLKRDGGKLKPGDIIAKLSGKTCDLMAIERIVLNLLGRMSGVATYTSRFVQKAKKINQRVLITPTRKTLWGLLDKRACVLGGGGTHRLSLDNAVLIKHNHLRASGVQLPIYLKKSLKRAKGAFVEIEVRNKSDALSAAEVYIEEKRAGPCFIMFDNMSSREISDAMKMMKKNNFYRHIFFEASGKISEKTISAFAKTGVDVLSIGAITHSAPMLDMSMRTNSPLNANAHGTRPARLRGRH